MSVSLVISRCYLLYFFYIKWQKVSIFLIHSQEPVTRIFIFRQGSPCNYHRTITTTAEGASLCSESDLIEYSVRLNCDADTLSYNHSCIFSYMVCNLCSALRYSSHRHNTPYLCLLTSPLQVLH